MGDFRAVIPDFCPVIPALYPRHSRESGNPDGERRLVRSRARLPARRRGLIARDTPILAFPRQGGRDPLASFGA